jgi:hypothetical protein
MLPRRSGGAFVIFVLLAWCFSTAWLPAAIAQAEEDLPQLGQRAAELVRLQRFIEALPLLEKLTVAEPANAQWQSGLGFALLAQATNTTDDQVRKQLRVRARGVFTKARDLGASRPLMDSVIQAIPPDGSDPRRFSDNPEAHGLMLEGEAFYGQGKLDDALNRYQRALEIDPSLYEAALFSGDVYSTRGDFDRAEEWYQRAISIDPSRETGYRYSATPLMKQGKTQAALERYVEAFIREPYNRITHAGLTQWAQATRTTIGHPAISIPVQIVFDQQGTARANVAVTPSSVEDGSSSWVLYSGVRLVWIRGRFLEAFPAEKVYRHSLAEEVSALRAVVKGVSDPTTFKTLNPSLAKLKKLEDDGLLEAYVLLARPDEGIAEDHAAFLTQSPDKLRRYVKEYLLTGGGR